MNLLEFLSSSKSAYHAIENLKSMLDEAGFQRLDEGKHWNLQLGKKYYIIRNDASIVAFTTPREIDFVKFNIVAAHSDSPTFKLKPNFKYNKGKYNMLNTEVYGGPIFSTWMDRPLDIVGRVLVKEKNKIKSKLVSFDKPMAIIPNSPIHFYPELNTGAKLNPQVDLIPLFSMDNEKGLLSYVAEKLEVAEDEILGYDLYLATLDKATIGGANDEFIYSPRIDNLECSYAIINNLINSSTRKNALNFGVVFNNEEVGSLTREGAASGFLADTINRVSHQLGLDDERYRVALANSFIISADNAQGFHPNYPQNYDPTNDCHMGGGVVIKSSARGAYTTDGYSGAILVDLCKRHDVKYQFTTNRSDKRGGSTLGAISLSHLSIPSVDIGLAQLAMHSSLETALKADFDELEKLVLTFYNNN